MIDRRLWLKTTSLGAGSVLFAPFLKSLEAHATGNWELLPKRFVFIVKASGLDKFNLVPKGIKEQPRLTDVPPSGRYESKYEKGKKYRYYPKSRKKQVQFEFDGHELPDVLKPLAEYQDQLSIIQGLSANHLKGNHTAGYGALSCANSELTPIAPSVDALLGLKHSTGPYPMFGMATNGTLRGQASKPDDSYVYPNLSAYKAGQGIAYQASPTKAFNELFGSAILSPTELKTKNLLQENLMDFLKDDAKRIRRQLSQDDKTRFDAYVNTFESLRVREKRKATIKNKIKKYKPDYKKNKYTSMQHMDRMESQFELGTAALIAGLTNVITLRPDTLGTQYQGLGFGNLGLHQIGHGATLPDGTTAREMRRKVDTYHMGLVAKMAKRLESIPEGDGTMLDHTLIVYLSCTGGEHHGGRDDWPVVMLGNVNDKLKTSQYVQLPSYGKKNHRTLANLYMAIMDAAEVSYGKHFGQIDSQIRDLDQNGPLEEILS